MTRTETIKKKSHVRGGYRVLSCLVAKQPRAHEHSAAAAAPSGTGAALDSSSTAVRCSSVAVAAKSEKKKMFADENTKIRVGV